MSSSAPYGAIQHAQSTKIARQHAGTIAKLLRLAVAFACAVLVASSGALTASASTSLGAAEHHVRELTRRIHREHVAVASLRRELTTIAARVQDARNTGDPPKPWIRARGSEPSVESRHDLHRHVQKRVRGLQRERAGVIRRLHATQRRTARLDHSKAQAEAYVWRIRPIGMCPVHGPHVASDDFGAPRWVNHTFHVHQGNDILAAYGTPIVAPFDGRAVASPNALGGMAVKVFGAAGYVYNAHLSRYGRLGPVTTGTVIGYVGNSGDARGGPAHDHFEWHPGGGPAVDPHPFLMMVC